MGLSVLVLSGVANGLPSYLLESVARGDERRGVSQVAAGGQPRKLGFRHLNAFVSMPGIRSRRRGISGKEEATEIDPDSGDFITIVEPKPRTTD
jgi:hypothetical protein